VVERATTPDPLGGDILLALPEVDECLQLLVVELDATTSQGVEFTFLTAPYGEPSKSPNIRPLYARPTGREPIRSIRR
jgi:hypothetical protein